MNGIVRLKMTPTGERRQERNLTKDLPVFSAALTPIVGQPLLRRYHKKQHKFFSIIDTQPPSAETKLSNLCPLLQVAQMSHILKYHPTDYIKVTSS